MWTLQILQAHYRRALMRLTCDDITMSSKLLTASTEIGWACVRVSVSQLVSAKVFAGCQDDTQRSDFVILSTFVSASLHFPRNCKLNVHNVTTGRSHVIAQLIITRYHSSGNCCSPMGHVCTGAQLGFRDNGDTPNPVNRCGPTLIGVNVTRIRSDDIPETNRSTKFHYTWIKGYVKADTQHIHHRWHLISRGRDILGPVCSRHRLLESFAKYTDRCLFGSVRAFMASKRHIKCYYTLKISKIPKWPQKVVIQISGGHVTYFLETRSRFGTKIWPISITESEKNPICVTDLSDAEKVLRHI